METATTIKASELRLGNWLNQKYENLNADGSYYYPNPIKMDDLGLIETYPDNYHPIPLTPEILEKAMNQSEEQISLKILICFRQHWGRLKYVHQLQNLYFALTGAELDVSL